MGHQYRPDEPRVNSKGKAVKYEHPTGARQHLDVLPSVRDQLKNPNEPLYITEGSKKADALASRGACAISIGGVFGFRGKNEHGGLETLVDWEHVPVNDRDVYVVLDSNVSNKPAVQKALIRLQRLLSNRRANVWIVYLPEGEGDEKVGVDDFLASGRSIEDLRALATTKLDDANDAEGFNANGSVTTKSLTGKRISAADDTDDVNDAGLKVLPNAPVFPMSALPPACRRVVEEGAKAVGCPPELLAGPMIATLGSAIGASRVLKIKNQWREPTTVYIAVIAPPGSKKSPALQIVLAPVMNRQAQLRKKHMEDKEKFEEELRAYEAERRKATKEGRTPGPPPTPPVLESTFLNDTTIEALGSALSDNPRGFLVASDELSGWIRSLDQYRGGKGADKQKYLSLWSNTSIRIDRKGDAEPQFIPHPCISVCGGIQPDLLPSLIGGDPKAGEDLQDGMLDRFLLCYPAPMQIRWSDADVSAKAVVDYRGLYDRLRELELDVDENGTPKPRDVEFTPEARKLFTRYHDELEETKEAPGFPTRLLGPWEKLIAYLARLALILAMCRRHEQVEAEDVENAKRLVDYFAGMARRAYTGLYGVRPADELATDLHHFLIDHDGEWEGTATQLFEQLDSDALPARPKDLSQKIRAIASRSPVLRVDDERTAAVRTLRIILTPTSSASSASALSGTPHRHAQNADDTDFAGESTSVISVTDKDDGWVEIQI